MNYEPYNFPEMTLIIIVLKNIFMNICTAITFFKILNNKNLIKSKWVVLTIVNVITAVVTGIIKYNYNYFLSLTLTVFMLNILYSIIVGISFRKSLLTTIISLSINYVISFVSIIFSFILRKIFNIENDYIHLIFMFFIHSLILSLFLGRKRFKHGFSFLNKKTTDEYFNILLSSIGISLLYLAIILTNFDIVARAQSFFAFILFTIIMFITIQKTLTMYYKHKKLIEELNETKEELENTKKDRDKVEQENIEISKTNHSISHKIKSLNRKIDKLMMNSEIANEIDLRDRISEISKEYNKEKVTVELSKTGIEIVDDMLDCMKEECIENNIEFELQLSGNIYHMTNNYIPKEELEILLADHIKDAIIAIKHTDNINRSILVRLGLIDEFYSLYIYDSGIEFEIDTLINLGIKPITTHKEDGGTGMGFLNTFDTLNKHKASMVIDEIGKPSKDNYTKVIMIRFDNKNEFKIKSYRSSEIEKREIKNNMKII